MKTRSFQNDYLKTQRKLVDILWTAGSYKPKSMHTLVSGKSKSTIIFWQSHHIPIGRYIVWLNNNIFLIWITKRIKNFCTAAKNTIIISGNIRSKEKDDPKLTKLYLFLEMYRFKFGFGGSVALRPGVRSPSFGFTQRPSSRIRE